MDTGLGAVGEVELSVAVYKLKVLARSLPLGLAETTSAALAWRQEKPDHCSSRSSHRQSWISFLAPYPAADNCQAAHRGCVLPATGPCCLLDKSKFKAQSDFLLLPIFQSCCIHLSLTPSTVPSTVFQVACRQWKILRQGTADRHAKMDRGSGRREVPIDAVNPVLVLHHTG